MSTLKIAVIQCDLVWEDPEANRDGLSQKIQELSSEVDLAVLPEMFTTGFTMSPQKMAKDQGPKTLEWMRLWAKKKDMALAGSVVFEDGGLVYNRLFFVFPNGEYKTYDKKHSFTLAGEDAVYTAGTTKTIVAYKGFSICPLICYDLRFPVWARNVEDYDVLLYVANWPQARIAAWDTLLKARAIENMAYCIGVNRIGTDGLGYEYPGHSAVYDELGNTLAYSEGDAVVYADLDREKMLGTRKKLRFLEDRDGFSLEA